MNARVVFTTPCSECEDTEGFGDTFETFCAGCGKLRTGPCRYVDVQAFANTSMPDYQALRVAQRKAEGEKLVAKLRKIGAPWTANHPLDIEHCRNCGSNDGWLAAALRTRNGNLNTHLNCATCGENGEAANRSAIPHRLFPPDRLPVYRDNSCTRCRGAGCSECADLCTVRGCKTFGVEFHHWLPRHIAKRHGLDAGDWPVGTLCREHHMLWHNLVTPNMARKADAA